MRRNRKNKKTKSFEEQWEKQFSEQCSQPQNEQQFIEVSKNQSKISKANQKLKKTTSKKKSELKHNPQLDSDSHNSQILDIRHADETTREHVRPHFLKRWDGQSNQFEIFPNQMKELSPMLQVYWKVKCRNMRAIVFVQFGKMQFLAFEDDAIKLNQIFKKKLKKFSKFLMVNFWYKEVQQAKQQLFSRKIPILIMNEIDDEEYKTKYGLVRRQVQEVITPALHITKEDKIPRSRLLMAAYLDQNKFQILLLDAESNHFYVQQFDQNDYLHEVRRVINKYRPVQLIIPDEFHKQIAKIARQICNPYIIEIDIKHLKIERQIDKYRFLNRSILFIQLKNIFQQQKRQRKSCFSKYRIVYVLQMVWNYLQSLSLLQKIFHQGIFHSLETNLYEKTDFFDSQVYQNLQIFRIQIDEEESYSKPGTLIHYLNDCKTNHGRKLLHKWIDQPLTVHQQILQRQQAIEQLFNHQSKILGLHQKLIAYESIEKKLGDIYHWTYRNSERGRLILTKFMNYEKQYDPRKNPAAIKIKQIVQTLHLIKNYQSFMKQLSSFKLKSSAFRKYTQLIDVQNVHLMGIQQINNLKCIPEIGYLTEIILRMISYDQITGLVQPAPGQIEVYDVQKLEIDRINILLDEELRKWKDYYKTQKITYVSVRSKNQLQIPKAAIRQYKQHKDLIFSSEVASFTRFTTPQTYRYSQQIMEHQKAATQSYEPFLQMVIQQFCKYRFLWDIYLQSMAKIDVLMSLAKSAKKMPVKCMPKFVKEGINIKNGLHPNLLQLKEDVIPNSVILEQNQKVLLLTGPNMGGKSTFLKQTCAMTIMAQIGSYDTSERQQSIIYDQIFCRMGASDRILQGKSTFYVELQETKMILSKATSSSLIVIDQLGRGTSTFDGMAIAQAILDYILTNIKAITLYSTHYTQITQRYKPVKQIKMMKMGYQKIEEDINFTYQLMEGVAQRSFANNVGKMVRLPSKILQIADKKAEELLIQTQKKKALRQACKLLGIKSLKLLNIKNKDQNLL